MGRAIHSRYSASLLHFVLSVIIFGIIISFLMNLYYPEPYFFASGGFDGLRIAAAVDIILGPLLTLFVYSNTKSTKVILKDCAWIFLLQVLALTYGVKAIYEQRPVSVVFYGDSFFSIAEKTYTDLNIDISLLKNYAVQESSLPLIYVGRDNRTGINVPPFLSLDMYSSFKESFHKVKNNKIFHAKLDKAVKDLPNLKSRLKVFVNKKGLSEDDVIYFDLFSTTHKIIMIFDREGSLLGYISDSYYSWYEMILRTD